MFENDDEEVRKVIIHHQPDCPALEEDQDE